MCTRFNFTHFDSAAVAAKKAGVRSALVRFPPLAYISYVINFFLTAEKVAKSTKPTASLSPSYQHKPPGPIMIMQLQHPFSAVLVNNTWRNLARRVVVQRQPKVAIGT